MRKVFIIAKSSGYIDDECLKKTHIVKPTGDGEFTFCGYAYVDEEYEYTKNKVDCKACIKDLKELEHTIKEYNKEQSK